MAKSEGQSFDWGKLTWRRWPLAVKLTAAMTGMVVLGVVGVTVLSLQREQQTFQRELEGQAELLLNSITVATSDALFALDVDYLDDFIDELSQQPGVVEAARLYDAEGRLIVDSSAQQTLVFGLEADPFGQRLVEGEATVFEWGPDHLLAGRAVTVGNQQIGAISVELSTAPLAAKAAAVRTEGIVVALGAAALGALLSLLLSRSIAEPVRQLTEATQRVAQGDLEQTIETRSGDELAVLAAGFNSMTAQIRYVIERLEQRADDLRKSEERIRAQNEELIRTNRELDEARQRAEEANRLKTQFLATMSHELRTPLNAVIGYTDLMLSVMRKEFTEKQVDFLQRILSNGEHLLALIDDVLDIARIEAGRVRLAPEPYSPAELLESLKKQMQSLADKKGLAFSTYVDSRLPAQLKGDTERLTQIAVNLIGNAIKFTDRGKVDVRFERADDSNWEMSVADTGAGIPHHAQEYIFDEFRQVDGSSQRVHSGTGLGLAIVRRLAMMMGGKVRVESEPGKGSTFTVQLPLMVAEPDKAKDKSV